MKQMVSNQNAIALRGFLTIILDHAKIGQRLELCHMSRLEQEEEFRYNLKTSGEEARQQPWEILNILLLQNLTNVSKDAVETFSDNVQKLLASLLSLTLT